MRARRRTLTLRHKRRSSHMLGSENGVSGNASAETAETAETADTRDAGSGTILGVAIIAATMLATGLVVTTFAVLALQQGVRNAADAAALAAADTASGAIAGFPCEAAAQAAMLNGAAVSSCAVGGLISDISVERVVGPFVFRSRSRAGPPPDVTG